MTRWRGTGLLIVGLVLSSCTPMRLDYESSTHIVRRGETLYTIAWQRGVDYRDLARWNALSNPDLIYPGQRLRLRPTAAVPVRTESPAASSRAEPASRPAQTVLPEVLPEPSWSWPTRGQIVLRFGSSEGIDSGIAVTGTSGQSIHAAADGRIVYVGTGLAGYGELVIIKHNDAWLSAYGHTQRVVVGQGDTVARGARIASMGLGPRREPRLHFEIRRNGIPVDPIPLLPPQQ